MYIYIYIFIYICIHTYTYTYIHMMKNEWFKNISTYFLTCKCLQLIPSKHFKQVLQTDFGLLLLLLEA